MLFIDWKTSKVTITIPSMLASDMVLSEPIGSWRCVMLDMLISWTKASLCAIKKVCEVIRREGCVGFLTGGHRTGPFIQLCGPLLLLGVCHITVASDIYASFI